MPFKLSTDIAKQIAALAADLNAHIQEHRDAYSRESEGWRESEGAVVETWLYKLENLADDLESAPDYPEG